MSATSRAIKIFTMYKTLCTGAINVTAKNLDEAINAAKVGGFDGLEIPVGAVADLIDQQGPDAAKKKFKDANIIPAGWGLPVATKMRFSSGS